MSALRAADLCGAAGVRNLQPPSVSGSIRSALPSPDRQGASAIPLWLRRTFLPRGRGGSAVGIERLRDGSGRPGGYARGERKRRRPHVQRDAEVALLQRPSETELLDLFAGVKPAADPRHGLSGSAAQSLASGAPALAYVAFKPVLWRNRDAAARRGSVHTSTTSRTARSSARSLKGSALLASVVTMGRSAAA